MPALYEKIVEARHPWSGVVEEGQVLALTDLEGQQAVDFLCYDANNPRDRYSSTNTLKVQGNIYIRKGTVLYADSGNSLMTVIEDSIGQHDTIYGCCSNPNNFLRYGVKTTESCYSNFRKALAEHGMAEEAIVANINWFMRVPVNADGSAGVANLDKKPESRVSLRAERDVLAVLSNCPQIHNPCNGYNPTPIKVEIKTQ
ncbi:MAG: DUF1989 domain-containing protein [Pseudomonadota bacterium]